MRLFHLIVGTLLVGACTDPNAVEVSLAPATISSLAGTTTVSAIVADDATPLDEVDVRMTIEYVDRNGTPRPIEPVNGRTDERGVFTAELTGLIWDGTGTVTVSTSSMVSGSATFAVLDRTPPVIEILPPTTDKRVGPGLPLDVQVRVSDEIGISQVTLATTATGGGGNSRTTLLASGTQDAIVTFRTDIPVGAMAGPSIQLYALARDLSGNFAAAAAITLTVDPAIVIATPPGLDGSLFVDGNTTTLNDPHSIAASPKDNLLYVADVGGGACNNHCIWQVDPTAGTVNPTPVFIGQGIIEGVAFDATGDNLYYTDRQNRTGRLTWGGTSYGTPVLCNNIAQQPPQDPYHLVFDPTLGLLMADDNSQDAVRVATCAVTTAGATFSVNGQFDQPRGMALDAAGKIYLSDFNRDRVFAIDRTTGAVSTFGGDFSQPWGIEWLAGGTSAFADRLMIASFGDRIVTSTSGSGELAAAYLRNEPVDLTFLGGTMFVLTGPSAGNRGRIYKVTGF